MSSQAKLGPFAGSKPSRARLLPRWAQQGHPIFDLEVQRQRRTPGIRTLQLGCLPALMAAAVILMSVVLFLSVRANVATGFSPYFASQYFATNLLGSLAGVLFVFLLVAGAVVNILAVVYAAPLISGEVELQSWGLLRTTMVKLPEIILAKFAATFPLMRPLLLGLIFVRAITLGTFLLLISYSFLRNDVYYWDPLSWQAFNRGAWLPAAAALLMASAYYVSQPLVQFLLSGAMGLFASVALRGRARAIAGGLALRLISWVAAVMVHAALLALVNPLLFAWSSPRYAVSPLFDALSNLETHQAIALFGGAAGGYVAALLLGQLGAVLFFLGMAQRRAIELSDR